MGGPFPFGSQASDAILLFLVGGRVLGSMERGHCEASSSTHVGSTVVAGKTFEE